ncbi:hypothetical protein [Brachybacterium sacelli]|uniref:DUF222 domain-containing protein n=1 Tax=Brachybacterium sacelli TaxID=173364 RepID=A0ABS4X7R5_9MICO|nr:hypothetical protein [Brachybacterium sacelli]MBP2383754.1 hypothetical protein [Brachybacterium sacelli]
MYSLGLDTPASHRHLHRSLRQIDHLERPGTHGWIAAPPGASSEIARLETSFVDAPVSLEQSLRAATMSALESAAHVRHSIQSNVFTLTSLRGMLRTLLMGAGRLGHVALPTTPQERETHAANVVGMEARSLERAITDIGKVTNLPGLKWDPDDVAEFRRKIATVNTARPPGDHSLIRTVADLIGTEAAAADDSVDPGALRDHLTWVWHTSSGTAHGFGWQSGAGGDFVTDLGAALSAFHFCLEATKRMWQ